MPAKLRRLFKDPLETILIVFSLALLVDLLFASEFLSRPEFNGLFQSVSALFLFTILGLWWSEKKFLLHLGLGGAFLGLFLRLPLIYNPGLPFLLWMHFACAFIYAGPEDTSRLWLMKSGFLLICGGYFLSGFDKLSSSPSWQNGTALDGILSGIYGRWGFVATAWPLIPGLVRKVFTWLVPAVEMSALIPVFFPRSTRPVGRGLLALQVGNLIFLRLFVVSLPMILFQLWVSPASAPDRPLGPELSKMGKRI
jgi:hypothetical protein